MTGDVDSGLGRPGMPLWKILVLGALRLNLNCDYDRLQELANNHYTIRQMLGHGIKDENTCYRLQTLKDNVSLLTPAILDEINQVVVHARHALKKADGALLMGRCDSFVVETDVHFPTDINLLYDAIRKTITLSADLSKELGCKPCGGKVNSISDNSDAATAQYSASNIPHRRMI